MSDETTQQARDIHRTVRMLRDLLARNYARSARPEAPGLPCCDLTFPQSNVLMVIQQEGEMTMKELATALNVFIGYKKAAEVVKIALAEGKSIPEVVREMGLLDEETLKKALDPANLTEPGIPGQ